MNNNPKATAVCKQMHQTVALLLVQPSQSCCQAVLLVDDTLATAMHTLHSMVTTIVQAMPGGLAFSQDMFLNIPLLADWHAILTYREQLVNDALLHANKKVINFDYQIGQKSSIMTEYCKENLNLKLLDSLMFSGSILMAL